VLNEEVSRLSLDPAFGLDETAVAFPLDAGLDLVALRSAAAAAGRLLVRALAPAADAATLVLALVITANIGRAGLGWAVLTFAGLCTARSFDPRLDLRASRDAAVLAAWIAIGMVGALILAPSTQDTQALVRLGLSGFGLLTAGRVLAYAAIRAVRAHHLVSERTLIVGAGPLSSQLATSLSDHPEFGLTPIGFLDARRVVSGAPIAVLGDYVSLEQVIKRFGVRRVIIGFGRNLDLVQAVRTCQALPVAIHVMSRGADLGINCEGRNVDHVMGLSLLRISRTPLTRTDGMLIKRVMDITAASLLLAVSAPIFLLAAAAVHFSSPGPVFFRQRRVGRNGKPFDVLKFRSVKTNNDSDTTWSVDSDNRVTTVGRLIRKTSIDELPQLINVLRGHMSLIGPRPERPHFVEQFSAEVPHYQDRHRAPVGITGWAQVNGLRGDTSIPERIRLDNYYVEHWSPWLDVIIALRTVGELLRGSSP